MRSYNNVGILVARCFVADGQFPTAFGPTTRQNLASVLGSHTGAETVLVRAFPAARLIRAFHCILPEK